MSIQSAAIEFGLRVKSLGFRVFVAKAENYGFITDDAGSRVLCFSFSGVEGGTLHGNYGPPSQKSGTGWRLEETPYDLHTAADVQRALHAHAPHWCGNGWKHYTTLEQHLALYGSTSSYTEL